MTDSNSEEESLQSVESESGDSDAYAGSGHNPSPEESPSTADYVREQGVTIEEFNGDLSALGNGNFTEKVSILTHADPNPDHEAWQPPKASDHEHITGRGSSQNTCTDHDQKDSIALLDTYGPTLGITDLPQRTTNTADETIHHTATTEAHTLVKSVLDNNPKALGIVILMHHQDVDQSVPDLESLTGIENGASGLKNAFANLGLAVLWLRNPSKHLVKAVIEIVSSHSQQSSQPPITIPNSYRYLFFYTTGHGANRVFFTKDGSISYNDVVESFRRKPSKFSTWYFFFDCCRSLRLDDASMYPNGDRIVPDVPELNLHAENCIVYATTSCNEAWGPGGGVSFMTREMVAQLKECITLDELITHLRQKIKTASVLQCPTSFSAVSKNTNLMNERNKAMRPSLVEPTISCCGSRAQFTVEVKKPLALNNDDSKFEKCELQISRADLWETPSQTVFENCTPPCSVSIEVRLPTTERRDNEEVKVRVIAHYKGDLKVTSEDKTVTLDSLVKPLCDSVDVKGSCTPKLKVSWSQEFEGNYLIREYYEINIISATTQDTLQTSTIQVDGGHKYCKMIPVPLLFKHKKVGVVVTGKGENQEVLTQGEIFEKSLKKDQCCRCFLSYLPALLSLLLFLICLTVVIEGFTAKDTVAVHLDRFVTRDVIEIAQGDHKRHWLGSKLALVQFSGWDVLEASCGFTNDNQTSASSTYCNAYSSSELLSYQEREDTETLYSNLTIAGRQSLPFDKGVDEAFSSYGLGDSTVFVSAKRLNSSGERIMDFLVTNSWNSLHEFVTAGEITRKSIVSNKKITFTDGSADQKLYINIQEPTFVYFATSTTVNITFESFDVTFTKAYYDANRLNIKKHMNTLNKTTPLFVTGDSDSVLICTSPQTKDFVNICVTPVTALTTFYYALFGLSILFLFFAAIYTLIFMFTCGHYCCKVDNTRGGDYNRLPELAAGSGVVQQ